MAMAKMQQAVPGGRTDQAAGSSRQRLSGRRAVSGTTEAMPHPGCVALADEYSVTPRPAAPGPGISRQVNLRPVPVYRRIGAVPDDPFSGCGRLLPPALAEPNGPGGLCLEASCTSSPLSARRGEESARSGRVAEGPARAPPERAGCAVPTHRVCGRSASLAKRRMRPRGLRSMAAARGSPLVELGCQRGRTAIHDHCALRSAGSSAAGLARVNSVSTSASFSWETRAKTAQPRMQASRVVGEVQAGRAAGVCACSASHGSYGATGRRVSRRAWRLQPAWASGTTWVSEVREWVMARSPPVFGTRPVPSSGLLAALRRYWQGLMSLHREAGHALEVLVLARPPCPPCRS